MGAQEVDVAIVGFGPVGQVLAALLGQAGHRVAVFERHLETYPLPRAVRLDGEVMRLFQRLGIAGDFDGEVVPVREYVWFGADGEPMLTLDLTRPSPTGWQSDYVFFQPAVEAALEAVGPALPGVTLHRGWMAQGLRQDADGVSLTVAPAGPAVPGGDEPQEVRARYLVGADGAGSFVREVCGVDWIDHGFSEHWLVTDVRPHDPEAFAHLPDAAQYCDPRRPRAAVRNGRTHRRWEFMLGEGEQPSDFAGNPDRVWELLSPYVRPDEATLVRAAPYEFRSLIAREMTVGRVLLAGDAAHLMPPFMGEGMCTGLRDAANLSWRLDLVLRGTCRPALLDSYTSERTAQNAAIVEVSMMMGQVACITDPAAAAGRDAAFRSGQVPPPAPPPAIGPGVRRDGDDPIAGRLAVQGEVERDGVTGLFGDVVGEGFAVVCATGDPSELLDRGARELLASIGARVVTLDPSVTGHVRDVSGALTAWLSEHRLEAAITRPDGYAFGGAASHRELGALVDELQGALGIPTGAALAR